MFWSTRHRGNIHKTQEGSRDADGNCDVEQFLVEIRVSTTRNHRTKIEIHRHYLPPPTMSNPRGGPQKRITLEDADRIKREVYVLCSTYTADIVGTVKIVA